MTTKGKGKGKGKGRAGDLARELDELEESLRSRN